MDVIAKYGEIETALKMQEIQSFDYQQEAKENVEKVDAKRSSLANDFLTGIMGNNQAMGG